MMPSRVSGGLAGRSRRLMGARLRPGTNTIVTNAFAWGKIAAV